MTDNTYRCTIKGQLGGHLIEIHQGADGLYYLVDPETPTREEIHLTNRAFQVRAAYLAKEQDKS